MRKLDTLLSYIYTRRIWGPRCPDFCPECPCCKAWATHDLVAGR